MHPLAPDLTAIADDELHKKRSDLMNRLVFAYRMGHADMVGQINLLIQDYDFEIQKRNQKMLDDLQKTNPGFSDKISIKK